VPKYNVLDLQWVAGCFDILDSSLGVVVIFEEDEGDVIRLINLFSINIASRDQKKMTKKEYVTYILPQNIHFGGVSDSG